MSTSNYHLIGPPSSTLARGPPGVPQLQIPPANILRSIPLITSAPTTINSSLLLASSSAGNSGTSVPSGLAATPIPAVTELPGSSAPVVLASSTPPVPPRLADRIWRGEYIAMSELLPERFTEPPEGETKKEDRKKTTNSIQSIASWSLGFSVYMGVMAVKHPKRVPDLAAYMGQIIQASRQFKGTPWQDYDTRFRMQAAADKRPRLAVVDTSLWAITFAKAEPREECKHCHSLDHESGDCTQDSTPEAKGKEPAAKRHRISEGSKLLCFDFQTGHCQRGTRCRFRHRCERCEADHPRYRCTTPRAYSRKSGTPYSREGKRGYY